MTLVLLIIYLNDQDMSFNRSYMKFLEDYHSPGLRSRSNINGTSGCEFQRMDDISVGYGVNKKARPGKNACEWVQGRYLVTEL